MPRVHFCIVSEQPIPNLTAALDSRLRADELVLLASRQMEDRARWIERVANRYGIRCHIIGLGDRADLPGVTRAVADAIVAFDGAEVVLNATGGQKPMSIAAYQVFQSRGLPSVYVETDNSATWLPPHADRERIADIEPRLRIEDYLEAYGVEIEALSRKARNDGGFATALVEGFSEFGDSLAALNWVGYEARNDLRATGVRPDKHNKRVLKLALERKLLSWDQAQGVVQFPDEEARRYVAGGWLEQHVFRQIEGHRHEWGVADAAYGAKVKVHGGETLTSNELDVVFLAHNHLYLVECKTRRMQQGKGGEEEDDIVQALYKLHAVRRAIGGLAGRAMLVSWRPAQPYHERRADVFDVRLVSGADLVALPLKLQLWCAARRLR